MTGALCFGLYFEKITSSFYNQQGLQDIKSGLKTFEKLGAFVTWWLKNDGYIVPFFTIPGADINRHTGCLT